MLAHHHGLGITAEQRFRFASLMSLAADDADLPDDPEFRAALAGYLEWGTRLAMHNSQPGADVVPQAPVPRWAGPDTALDLVNSRTTSRGITIQTYRPAGRPQYATATAD